MKKFKIRIIIGNGVIHEEIIERTDFGLGAGFYKFFDTSNLIGQEKVHKNVIFYPSQFTIIEEL